MKLFLMMLLAGTLQVLAEDTNRVALTDQQLGEKLNQAVLLGRVGLYDEAEAACKEVLAQKPDQPTAKQMIREIEELRQKRDAQDPGYELRTRLEQLIVPEVNFRNADPKDVIDFLAGESRKLSPDKSQINFVWLVSADAKLSPVTLNLKNVAFADVLSYVTQLAGLKYRVEAHAVAVYKPEPARSIPPASEPLHVKPQ
jgi:hypothetical protein